MQSEAGAAGGVHGTRSTGAMPTTFTSSQGLLLNVPVLYKLAEELHTCVPHIAARAIAGQATAIFGDHSDVMATRQAMVRVKELTGRSCDIFECVGNPYATDVVVIMRGSAQVVKEFVDYSSPVERIGIMKVYLYCPGSAQHFLAAVPKTTQRVAMLDRYKETGLGEPLYPDVGATSFSALPARHIKVTSGHYGLAGKDPSIGKRHSIFKNLVEPRPQHPFAIGFGDDVIALSLKYTTMNTVPAGTAQGALYGLGSDATVAPNKNALELIARAKYVGIHKKEYVESLSAESRLSCLKPGCILVPHSPGANPEPLKQNLSLSFRQYIRANGFVLYNIDVAGVARKTGMGRVTIHIMQTAFLHLAQLVDADLAIPVLQKGVDKTCESKGPEVVRKNISAIDMSLGELYAMDLPDDWHAPLPGEGAVPVFSKGRGPKVPADVSEVLDKIHCRGGGSIPVCKFEGRGTAKLDVTQWAKRGVAARVPVVNLDKGTQCNQCYAICPRAVIPPSWPRTRRSRRRPGAGMSARPRAATRWPASASASRPRPWTARTAWAARCASPHARTMP